jgi:hypothetical protein
MGCAPAGKRGIMIGILSMAEPPWPRVFISYACRDPARLASELQAGLRPDDDVWLDRPCSPACHASARAVELLDGILRFARGSVCASPRITTARVRYDFFRKLRANRRSLQAGLSASPASWPCAHRVSNTSFS